MKKILLLLSLICLIFGFYAFFQASYTTTILEGTLDNVVSGEQETSLYLTNFQGEKLTLQVSKRNYQKNQSRLLLNSSLIIKARIKKDVAATAPPLMTGEILQVDYLQD